MVTLPGQSQPVCVSVCLAYAWNRNLDGYSDRVDDIDQQEELQDSDFENPSAAIVSLLERYEKRGIHWAILTNGKQWRLYSAKAHNRATNYYELDLEDILAIGRDQPEEIRRAFSGFWLFFHANAFIPLPHEGDSEKLTFLDYTLRQSVEYALALGESLKEVIFAEVFEHFAGSLINDARKKKILPADLTRYDEQQQQHLLKPFFDATLTFLYRLLFLLYAESRNLLPTHERQGYYEQSLTQLKGEIASQLGNNRAQEQVRLDQAYKTTSYRYYQRLQGLFRAIDLGNEEWNVPHYNGGLFKSEVEIRDLTQRDGQGFPILAQARPEELLTQLQIDDHELAFGLDLLARAKDKDHADRLMMVDYKSLGVRQLGSIYEGLLEFRLRVATEEMVELGERIVTLREAVNDRHYKEGRSRIIKVNEVYIENDRHERKTTGSYYTPDYVVEYIVAQSVGPIMDEKERQLLQKFRNYERELHDRKERNRQLKKLHLPPEPLRKIESRPELVDAFFDIKVIDPAMGSGHFPVETVDYITRRMLSFLSQFGLDPVTHALNLIRDDIVAAMEKQNVAIDRSKLTDINLLKRQILKRCIYGVDINPMAVELAKVSVWLDSFTIGAPLSFLDHHLRCGNSLLGVKLAQVQPDAASESGPRQLNMFNDNIWLDIIKATGDMINIGRLGDSTTEQMQESQDNFQTATIRLIRPKRLLDVYLSRWYSNPFFTRKAKQAVVDPADDFLHARAAATWLETGNDSGFNEEQRSVLDNAAHDQQAHSFFHWELEFPEVFIDRRSSQIDPDGGFDAIVGNPPYVRQEGLGSDKAAFEQLYSVYNSIADLYTYFIERGCSLLRPAARFGMITANKFMRAHYGEKLRHYLLNEVQLETLIDFGDLPVFGDATTYPVILLIEKAQPQAVTIAYTRIQNLNFDNLQNAIQTKLQQLPATTFNDKYWSLSSDVEQKIVEKLHKKSILLDKYIQPNEIRRGILTGYNEAFIIDTNIRDRLINEDSKSSEVIEKLLIGQNIKKYKFSYEGLYVIFTRRGIDIKRYPAIEKYLRQFQSHLEPRPSSWDDMHGKWHGRKPGPYKWYEIQDNVAYYADFEKPKIIYPNICMQPEFTYDENGFYSNQKTFIIPGSDLYLLAILNSQITKFFFAMTLPKLRGGYYEPSYVFMKDLPIRRITFPDSGPLREQHHRQAQRLYDAFVEQPDGVPALLVAVERHLAHDPEEADVVHDLLEKLAGRMLELNKTLQAREQRFLDWLTSYLRIQPQPDPKSGKIGLDALTKKSELLDYPGDYQKETKPLSEQALQEILTLPANRKRYLTLWNNSVWNEISERYRASLAEILPLSEQLRQTDTLIDEIVYRLYDLTPAEIEIVQGAE